MKKTVLTLLLTIAVVFSTATVYAADDTQSTGYTITKTTDGRKTISQDAYLPAGTYASLGLNGAQDLYVGNQKLYIADTGNKRALCVDIETNSVQVIGEGILSEPRGISADESGDIFIADAGKGEAYRFSADGELEFTFVKPTAPSYGKKVGFKPTKIAPGDGGGVYIISEGTQAGIVHMSGYGDFLGYFASNEVNTSLFDKLVDIFLTEDQKSSFLKRTPPSFGDIFKGSDRLVYTINKGMAVKPKKHSISGLNMLSKSTELPEINNAVDLHVTADGRIFVINLDGIITEITADGYFLCSFGGYDAGANRIGLFDVPSGIGVDDSGYVYVLDKEKNSIAAFSPSPVQSNIHNAINYYQNGQYDESQKILDEVLKFNNTSYFAHIYSAKNYMQKAEYELALEHYKISNDKGGYSDAYWEIRNVWLQDNLIYIIVALIALVVIWIALGLMNKKTKWLDPVKKAKRKFVSLPIIRDLAKLPFAMRHPIDNAYNIKVLETGSYMGATVIYFILLVIIVLYQTATGFIFAQTLDNYSVFNTIVVFAGLLFLFVMMHHLISSINDGRGTLRGIYTTIAYSCAPIILFMPFVIIFSNFATVDEKFFLDFALYAFIGWSICNIIVGLIEIHDYKFSEIIKNLLVTLFAIGVAILALSIGYLLIKQIFAFVFEIIVEVRLRV